MFAIAEKTLGDASRWEEIHALNPQITNPDLIFPGQEIKIMGTLPAPQAAMFEQTPTVVPPRPKSPEIDDRECLGTWQCAPQADNLSGQSAAPAQSPVIKNAANDLAKVTTVSPQDSGTLQSPTEVLNAHIAKAQQTEAAEQRAADLAKEQHREAETAFNVADVAAAQVIPPTPPETKAQYSFTDSDGNRYVFDNGELSISTGAQDHGQVYRAEPNAQGGFHITYQDGTQADVGNYFRPGTATTKSLGYKYYTVNITSAESDGTVVLSLSLGGSVPDAAIAYSSSDYNGNPDTLTQYSATFYGGFDGTVKSMNLNTVTESGFAEASGTPQAGGSATVMVLQVAGPSAPRTTNANYLFAVGVNPNP